jgi:glycosyltransferase involved in cell wall biosynthesis
MNRRSDATKSGAPTKQAGSIGQVPSDRDIWSVEHGPTHDPEESRREVIIISYCCAPSQGSEAGAGWSWAKAASKVAHVTLITCPDEWRHDIEQEIAEENLAITPYWVNTPRWLRAVALGKISRTIEYCAWQAWASIAVRRLESDLPVDAVHHVTFASDSLPSALLASKAPVRVWGPVGGAGRSTVGLYRYLTLRGIVFEMVRGVSNRILRATSGRSVARHATLVAALNNDVRDYWRRVPTPVVVQSNTALDRSEISQARVIGASEDASSQRTALFVGRLIPLKGLRLAVRSLEHAPNWKLVVLGEGPDRKPATKLAERLGVADRIEFRGQVPRAEVLQALREADGLLFPSFHDSSGWAAGEASAQGCPVVCLDTGGPSLQAGRNAHVVPMSPERSLPRRIGHALQNLPHDSTPDDHLLADRIPALLETWYTGSVNASTCEGRPVVPVMDTPVSGPALD